MAKKKRSPALFVLAAAALFIACEQAASSKSSLPGIPGIPDLIPGTTRLTASWPAAEGADSYEVWVSKTADRNNAILNQEVAGRFVVIMDLENDQPYWVWIRAKNSAGHGGFSEPGSGTPVQYQN
jgi:hypothetical protein